MCVDQEIGIQGMRGWAAMGVLLFHISTRLSSSNLFFIVPLALLRSGYSGVDLFFLISGYILTRKMLSEDYKIKGKFNAVKYYIRRMSRIWPLYFISIPVLALTFPTNIVWQQYLFIQNLFQSTFTLTPLWTIVIEELFYLILPIWVFIFRKNWILSFASMLAFSFGYMAFLAFGLHTTAITYYQYSQFPMFAIVYAFGTIIAMGKKYKLNIWYIAAVWLVFSLLYTNAQFTWFVPITFSIVYYLMLCNADKSRLFTHKVSTFLGSLTYPIYLFGLPMQAICMAIFGTSTFLWAPMTVLSTILLAFILHKFVEKPFIALGRNIEALIFGYDPKTLRNSGVAQVKQGI